MELRGSYCALTTPFSAADEEIDWRAFAEHVEFQIAGGSSGIVVCGTTGESPTVSHEEHEEVMKRAVQYARKRTTVIAGTGSNSTREALRLSRRAKEVGCDALLVVTPYYNRPSQDGLVRHFLTLVEKVDLPVILYNIPGRTGCALTVETVAKLAEHPRIAAIKEATGSVQFSMQLRRVTTLPILSGDDALTLPLMALGAVGVVSVAANILPREVQELATSALEGDFTRARSIHDRLMPLFDALFVETNPVPVKAALAHVGRASATVRPPLALMKESNIRILQEAMRTVGLAGTEKDAEARASAG